MIKKNGSPDFNSTQGELAFYAHNKRRLKQETSPAGALLPDKEYLCCSDHAPPITGGLWGGEACRTKP